MARTRHETEHLDDPPDHADAYALLDGGQIAATACPSCLQFVCECRGYPFHEEAPEEMRNYRRGARRRVGEDRT